MIHMNKYLKEKPNYNKFPVIETGLQNVCAQGWKSIVATIQDHVANLKKINTVIAVECYHGVLDDEILSALQYNSNVNVILTTEYFLSKSEIEELVYPDVTDDEVFGYVSRLTIDHFFNKEKLNEAKQKLTTIQGVTFVYGCGATLLCPKADILIYADMPRWEIQQRFRREQIGNLGVANHNLKTSLQYKRAFYVDWRVCDRIKKQAMPKADYILDTTNPNRPNVVNGKAFFNALELIVQQPFRLAPFFDPGPWGGQWMKEYCDLDQSKQNFAWCFDCVPEENSLLLRFDDFIFETPSINLIYFQSKKLLGEAVQGRFGNEFPIRFDFLDTMDGGNLSLQVHPTTEYAQEKFGIHYTQDESYYMLDADDDACVYLGLKKNANLNEMLFDLNKAQDKQILFDADKYIEKWAVKKHDHVHIPAGTIHCSGKNSMVLEISATPFNFTFKLWDWGRLGLDGKPRPINIEHGSKVIDATRKTDWVKEHLINTVTVMSEGEGWREERTGLHEREFIETRRHWFKQKVIHHTNEGVQVLNLVEGREVIVESVDNSFEPFIVHYAETFIVPASVKHYSIRPYGESEGKECATIKAFIRTQP